MTTDSSKHELAITEVQCAACGHRWIPRTARLPVVCPRCKRFNWKKEDWEASKHKKGRRRKKTGGKNADIRHTTRLGPKTEKFLEQRKET